MPQKRKRTDTSTISYKSLSSNVDRRIGLFSVGVCVGNGNGLGSWEEDEDNGNGLGNWEEDEDEEEEEEADEEEEEEADEEEEEEKDDGDGNASGV